MEYGILLQIHARTIYPNMHPAQPTALHEHCTPSHTSLTVHTKPHLPFHAPTPALSLAMNRDGSSGGVIRTVVIDKDGVERSFLNGNDLPYVRERAKRQMRERGGRKGLEKNSDSSVRGWRMVVEVQFSSLVVLPYGPVLSTR